MSDSDGNIKTVDSSDRNNKPQEDSDDDVILLYEYKTYYDPKKRTTYYDNDSEVNKQEVLKRWNKKKLSDPNVNLTVTHYRQRLFGEPAPTRPLYRYKPGIFLELDDKDQQSSSKANDEEVLKEKMEKINLEKESLKHKIDITYHSSISHLKSVYRNQIKNAKLNFKTNRFKMIKSRQSINKIYYSTLNKIKSNYHQKMNKLEQEAEEKIKALKSLYESGAYEPGRLNEYETMQVYQPQSKRRKYFDDGLRRVLLPEKVIKNILIEDEIYKYYYGIPK